MSKDKYKAPQGSDSEFVDEILAEARKMRGNVTEELDDQDIPHGTGKTCWQYV